MTKYYEIIKAPIVTEKSSRLAEDGRYTFKVEKKANKVEIKNAIETIFKVKVVSVNTLTVLPKHRRVGKHSGLTAGYKKAIVTLVPGQKIEGFSI